jgi:hypothetical protein
VPVSVSLYVQIKCIFPCCDARITADRKPHQLTNPRFLTLTNPRSLYYQRKGKGVSDFCWLSRDWEWSCKSSVILYLFNISKESYLFQLYLFFP